MGCIYSNHINRVEPILDKRTENPVIDASTDKSDLFVVTRNRRMKTCSSPTLARNQHMWINRPKVRASGGISFEVVEASPRKTVPIKLQRREVKCITEEEITEKLVKAEKRRKEIQEEMIMKFHNERGGKRTLFEKLEQKKIIEKQECQKDKMVAAEKNREMKLKELRDRLKEKNNKSEIVRSRREITGEHIGGSLVSRPVTQTSAGFSFEILQINPALPEGHPARLETLSRIRKNKLEKINLNRREKSEEDNIMPRLAAVVMKEKEELQIEKMMKAQKNREKRLLEMRERLRAREARAARIKMMKDLNLDDLDDPS